MTYAELCRKVDAAAGKPVMTQECPHCGDSNWPGHCPDIDRTCCRGIECARCLATGRIPLPEAEGAWALLGWLLGEGARIEQEGAKFTITMNYRKVTVVDNSPREALFAARAKMLEQEAS